MHNHFDLPTAYIGLALISAYSTAIGTGYHVKNSLGTVWFPVWACFEGMSSSGKSKTIGEFFAPFKNMQRVWEEERRDMTDEERANTPARQIIYTEGNIATLFKQVLPANPKGIFQDADEILSWIGSFNKTSKGKDQGTDEQFWLTSWECEPFWKTLSANQHYYIPRPFMNVVGGIQTLITHKLFANDRGVTGFIFRLLFAIGDNGNDRIAMPDYSYEMPPEYRELHARSIKTMYDKCSVFRNPDDESRTITVDKLAMQHFMLWSNNKGGIINNTKDRWEKNIKSGIFGKIVKYAFKFAGILHISDKVFANKPLLNTGEVVDINTMIRALKLCDYFYNSAWVVSQRVNRRIVATPEVMRWKTYFALNLNNQEIGNREYPKKSAEAARKAASRRRKELLMEYPKILGADNG